jgi:hypothetical protein
MISMDDMDKIKSGAARLIDVIGLNAPDEVVRHEINLMRQLAGQPTENQKVIFKNGPLPPNPDGRNYERAEWAGLALRAFMDRTGTDIEDVVADFLDDLMHWCDRNDVSFQHEYERGRGMYRDETSQEVLF